jgi:uncharacterized protein YcnI
MKSKVLISVIAIFTTAVINVSSVLAHAAVKPSTVSVGSFTDFSLGVPSEKALNTVAVKLTLPKGLIRVTPVVKPGWRIEVRTDTESSHSDNDENTTSNIIEIAWMGGVIPTGQKDLFSFSAQVPVQETELEWKVEQTYSDGTRVSWSIGSSDSQPKDSQGNPDFSEFGPSSKTKVINDLKSEDVNTEGVTKNLTTSSNVFSITAIALAAAALGIAIRKKS